MVETISSIEAGFLAGRHKMIFEDLFEPIDPMFARRPLDQPVEHMFAGHVAARVRDSGRHSERGGVAA